MSERTRFPNRRASETIKATIGGQNVYITYSRFADGRIGEVFCAVNKSGSAFRGLLDGLAITISIALQYGVPLEVMTSALKNISFEPNGAVDGNPLVERCTSIMDYLVRALDAESRAP